MTVHIKNSSSPDTNLSDMDLEAQVFRDLERQRQTRLAKDDGIVIYQYPDDRTLFQRLRAGWQLRQQRAVTQPMYKEAETVSEPEWVGHWATTKYI